MLRARLIATTIATRCFAVILILGGGGYSMCLVSEAAAQAGGWKAASSSRPTSSAVPTTYAEPSATAGRSPQNQSNANTPWRLPNSGSAAASAKAAPAAGRRGASLSQTSTATSHTPRDFEPSASARPLRSTGSSSVAPVANVQKHTPSAAVVSTPAVDAQRTAAYERPHRPVAPSSLAPHLPASRSTVPDTPARHGRPLRMHARVAPPREHVRAYSSKLWETINVAFEGSQEIMTEPESLPLPQHLRSRGQAQPMPPGKAIVEGPILEHHDGMLVPYDEPMGYCGGDCGGMGCGDGTCSCGEVGCACEPTCGCPCGCGAETPCILACGDDVCLAGKGDAEACHTIRIGIPKWQELMVFGGVHGFKGPYDQVRDSGNFGIHEGFNAGFKVPFTSAGYQIGYQAVHSQLHGDKDTDISDPHTQQFVTFGLFHREQDGIQLGVAWDMLRDERFGAVDFHQLRSEFSFIDRGCHEFGFAAAIHLNEHEVFPADDDQPSAVFQASDQFLLFYRFHGARGGEGRVFGGVNDDDDGIVGADLLIPLQDRWSLGTGFTYLIPDDPAGQQGAAHEAWNIGINLVWHWDCRARNCHSNCYRPLFNVADNGYLIVDERPGAAPAGVGGN